MAQSRPVPRNIDAPNRMTEYIAAFIIGYYGTQFLFQMPIFSFFMGGFFIYAIYKITKDKPEGAFFRVFYRLVGLGKMMPSPKKAPKLEI